MSQWNYILFIFKETRSNYFSIQNLVQMANVGKYLVNFVWTSNLYGPEIFMNWYQSTSVYMSEKNSLLKFFSVHFLKTTSWQHFWYSMGPKLKKDRGSTSNGTSKRPTTPNNGHKPRSDQIDRRQVDHEYFLQAFESKLNT